MILLFLGRKVAIDASMSIYQFLIAVRQDGSTLTNAEGETTRFALSVSQIFDWCCTFEIFVFLTHTHTHTRNHFMAFFWDYPGKPVPEEIFFWT